MYLAVDLGASSGRVVAGRLVDGVMRTEELARFENRPVRVLAAGRSVLQWDLPALWRGVSAGLVAAARLGDVRSVGVDTWAVDYGLLDADGALLGQPVHYRDERTAGRSGDFFARMDPAAHYAITGAQVQPFNTVFQLLAEDRARLGAAHRLALLPDLLSSWLGAAPGSEVTNASTTGLLDARSRRWSPAVLAEVEALTGVALWPLLGELVEPGTVTGEISGENIGEVPGEVPGQITGRGAGEVPGEGAGAVARSLSDAPWRAGLAGARIVAVGSHDTASAVAAVPMTEPGEAAYISSGTWSLVGLELDAPVLTEAARAANHSNELGVDGTVRYLKNVAGMWLVSESQRTWRDRGERAELPELLAAAARAEPRRTVVDVDDPVFLPPGDMPGRIAALARASGQPVPRDPGETIRAILDSLVVAYRAAIDELAASAGREVRVIHVVGGGARNALLCQLTADATGLPVVAGPVEGAALGNLLVQARADGALAGSLATLRAASARSTPTTTYVPG